MSTLKLEAVSSFCTSAKPNNPADRSRPLHSSEQSTEIGRQRTAYLIQLLVIPGRVHAAQLRRDPVVLAYEHRMERRQRCVLICAVVA